MAFYQEAALFLHEGYKMKNRMEYSVEQIRSITQLGRTLLKLIEEKAEKISKISEEICNAHAGKELDVASEALKRNLTEMLSGYETQISHLEKAAELYEECVKEVYAEVEQGLEIRGTLY